MMNIDIWCFLWHFLIYPTQIKWIANIEWNRERERRTHNCFRIICSSNKIHFLHSQMNLMAANICLRSFATCFFCKNYFLIVEKKTFLISCILYRRIPCAYEILKISTQQTSASFLCHGLFVDESEIINTFLVLFRAHKHTHGHTFSLTCKNNCLFR